MSSVHITSVNRSWATDSKLSLDVDSQKDDSWCMIVQPYHLYIERIDPAKKMARFYALAIQPTLFGQASLLRCWGRIGCRGQQKIHIFAHEDQAVELFLDLLFEKRKKGYRPRTNCGKPTNSPRFAPTTQ